MARDPQKVLQHQQRERALELGRGNDPGAARELTVLLKSPFADVRRLAASAMGKLAPLRPASQMVVAALRTPALSDPHPQVRQYALKAIAKYPEVAAYFLDEFRDVARNGSLLGYVRTAAAEVVAAIENFLRERDAAKTNRCRRCSRVVSDEEFIRSMDRFARPYCTHCFDELLLEGANFEATVEGAKEKMATDGTAVQSAGEKRIADWLAARKIAYVYDERFRVARDTLIRSLTSTSNTGEWTRRNTMPTARRSCGSTSGPARSWSPSPSRTSPISRQSFRSSSPATSASSSDSLAPLVPSELPTAQTSGRNERTSEPQAAASWSGGAKTSGRNERT